MPANKVDLYRLLIADVYELAGRSRTASEHEARAHGQTVARWHVLSVLSGGAMSASAIARRLGLARQSVQRVVDDLRGRGDVRVDVDPADRRAPLVSITPQGQQVLETLVAESDGHRVRELARAGVTVRELEEARSVVQRLLAMLDEPSR